MLDIQQFALAKTVANLVTNLYLYMPLKCFASIPFNSYRPLVITISRRRAAVLSHADRANC